MYNKYKNTSSFNNNSNSRFSTSTDSNRQFSGSTNFYVTDSTTPHFTTFKTNSSDTNISVNTDNNIITSVDIPDEQTYFVKKVIQKSHFRPYEPGSSSYENCKEQTNLHCNLGDWEYDTLNSGLECPSRPRCSVLDPSTCPNINDSLVKATWDTAPIVNCFYDASKFNSIEDIDNYITVYGEDNVVTNQIMPFFCLSGNVCVTGTSDEAQLCQNWVANNPQVLEDTIKKKCCVQSSLIECECHERLTNPIYQTIKQDPRMTDISDSCWWKACENTDNPTIVLDAGTGKCPNDLCSVINEIVNNSGLFDTYTVAEIENVVDCNIIVLPKTITSPNQEFSTFSIVFFILFFLILIAIIIYLITQSNKK